MALINNKIDIIAKDLFENNSSNFAKRLNVTHTTIKNYRTDKAPKFDFIMRLVNELDISWKWLIEDKGDMLSTDIGKVNEPAPGYNNNELLQVYRDLIASKESEIKLLKENLDKAKEDATYYKRLADQKKKFENTS